MQPSLIIVISSVVVRRVTVAINVRLIEILFVVINEYIYDLKLCRIAVKERMVSHHQRAFTVESDARRRVEDQRISDARFLRSVFTQNRNSSSGSNRRSRLGKCDIEQAGVAEPETVLDRTSGCISDLQSQSENRSKNLPLFFIRHLFRLREQARRDAERTRDEKKVTRPFVFRKTEQPRRARRQHAVGDIEREMRFK